MSAVDEGKRAEVEPLRDRLSNALDAIDERALREVMSELLEGDGDLLSTLLEKLTLLSNSLLEAGRAVLKNMEGLPPERAAGILARPIPGADGNLLGELINAFSQLLVRLHEEHPELFVDEHVEFFSKTARAIDFGKLRKALNYLLADRLEGLGREIEIIGDNPVALVNLFSVVAPTVNQVLQVLKTLFKVLDLPAEAITYGLFNILEQVDWNEATQVINGAAAFLVKLHRGSYILGDGSLYSIAPFSRIASELAEGIDGPLLAEALVAVGEESEAMISSMVEQTLRNVELVSSLTGAVASLAGCSLRVLSVLLENYSSIPQEDRSRIRDSFTQNLDAEKLARLSRSLTSILRNARIEKEERRSEMTEGRFKTYWREVMEPLRVEIQEWFSPVSLAKRANLFLRAVNRRLQKAPTDRTYANAVFDSLDQSELESLFCEAGLRLRRVLSTRPEFARTLSKGIITIIYHGIMGVLAGLRRSRKTRWEMG